VLNVPARGGFASSAGAETVLRSRRTEGTGSISRLAMIDVGEGPVYGGSLRGSGLQPDNRGRGFLASDPWLQAPIPPFQST